MKTCINCGVVVEDNAVLFCPECGAGDLKEQFDFSPERKYFTGKNSERCINKSRQIKYNRLLLFVLKLLFLFTF